jgi:hypothetical protein
MVSLFFVVGCKKNDEKKPVEPPEPGYPIDISFSPYFVRCAMTSWIKTDCENRKVSIINSKEELESYYACMNYYLNINLPSDVDFSKYSLLYVRSSTSFDMSYIVNNSLQQLSENEYLWNIDYFPVPNDMGGIWISIIKIKKIETNSIVYLNIDTMNHNGHQYDYYNNCPYNYPIEQFTVDYSLPESCQWTDVVENKVTLIQSDSQFQNYISCNNIHKPYVYSMLLTKISVPKSIKTISKTLFFIKTKSILNLEIELSNNNQPEEKIISLLFLPCPCFSDNVELNVNIINQ